VIGQTEMSDAYRGFLGLCSHEYFHTWNVKRIKPAVFAPYDLSQENYTTLLWLFEGFTSYYDDLMLLRAGVIDSGAYLKLIEKTINNVHRGSGRLKQSVAESSFDAWTKYYRQDENAPNAIVSYYAKGSLVALLLDLVIRRDDAMRALWRRYGRDFYSAKGGRGVSEQDVEALFDEITGLKLKPIFDLAVRGTRDLPLSETFAAVGIDLADRRKAVAPSMAVRTQRDGSHCKLGAVHEGGAAHKAGLSAGDVLVAIDGLRVTSDNLDGLLQRYRVGDTISVHAFRRDELMQVELRLEPDAAPQFALEPRDKPEAGAKLRKAWLRSRA
jgi:predicted metalloprotease with PDZ domain